jgi:hypothetical protein
MDRQTIVLAAVTLVVALGCDENSGPSSPSTTATVRIVFMGSTARRTNLPPFADACVNGVGMTHIHPSWQGFAATSLQQVPPDRYEISFIDVPVETRVSFRINDQNSCDENPTGAVTRNIFANEVRLVQNTTTPGNGDEPGFAFTVARDASVRQ